MKAKHPYNVYARFVAMFIITFLAIDGFGLIIPMSNFTIVAVSFLMGMTWQQLENALK